MKVPASNPRTRCCGCSKGFDCYIAPNHGDSASSAVLIPHATSEVTYSSALAYRRHPHLYELRATRIRTAPNHHRRLLLSVTLEPDRLQDVLRHALKSVSKIFLRMPLALA